MLFWEFFLVGDDGLDPSGEFRGVPVGEGVLLGWLSPFQALVAAGAARPGLPVSAAGGRHLAARHALVRLVPARDQPRPSAGQPAGGALPPGQTECRTDS